MKKKGLNKKIIIIATICLVFASSMNVFAWEKQSLRCVRCPQINISYGIDEGSPIVSCGRPAGVMCDYCNKPVPKGQYHSYFIINDTHFFKCTSSKCKNIPLEQNIYKKEFLNRVVEHEVDYVD